MRAAKRGARRTGGVAGEKIPQNLNYFGKKNGPRQKQKTKTNEQNNEKRTLVQYTG